MKFHFKTEPSQLQFSYLAFRVKWNSNKFSNLNLTSDPELHYFDMKERGCCGLEVPVIVGNANKKLDDGFIIRKLARAPAKMWCT